MPETNNFEIIYQILTALERAMDCPAFDITELSADSFHVSQERMYRYLEMLQDEGLVKNAGLNVDINGNTFLKNPQKIRITLAGLEYLQENSIMRRIYNAARGITELVP